MSRKVALLLVLVFLAASCTIFAKPAFSSADAAENSWAGKAPMHEARGGLSVAAVNGKIYAIGGSTESGLYPPSLAGGFVGTNEEYYPATDTWATKTPMPTPRAYFAIAVYQNKIYCIGGTSGIGSFPYQGIYDDIPVPGYILSSVTEVYDPATDKWENKTSAPAVGMMMKASVLNGKIYLIDGNLNEVYDPVSDTWTTKASPPISAEDFGAAGGNDYQLVVFENRLHVAIVSSSQLITYDEENDSWSQGTTIPAGDYCNIALGMTTGIMAPKRLYLLFVIRGIWTKAVNQAYDFGSNLWTTVKSLPTNRLDFEVAVLDDKLYAIGGYTLDNSRNSDIVKVSAVNEQYTPVGYGAVPPSIHFVSPENANYTSSNVSLTFTLNKPASWIGYSLDGQENVTVSGNATLTDLVNGKHNVTVYARDDAGNIGASEPTYFTIAKPEPPQEPFPTVPVVAVASGASAIAIGVGLLVYFKKRIREGST